jgi:hypothetical protein
VDTPIRTDDDLARSTDSIRNASLPLPKWLHVGALPKPGEEFHGGYHRYPGAIVEQQLSNKTTMSSG